jgi:phosphatidylserine/phosphatidylglycerophosphate/cardiolipin synthase-like enzyme
MPQNLAVDGILGRADAALGEGLERLVVAHHRRRLRRIGRLGAFEPPAGGWAGGEPPPRSGNLVEVFVDGAEALPAIAAEIESARSHVYLAGWNFSPDFHLRENGQTLRELLAEAAERIDLRVLAWAGAPLPFFHPDRGEMREMREQLVRGTRIACALDDHERPLHCHHEKLVLVDGQVAFVGGIDLTSLAGNRYDSPAHPPRGELGWHDAATRLRGPVVTDVAAHFALRWQEVTGEELAATEPPPPAGDVEVQLVRTVPEKVYKRLPRGEFRILESYLRALRSAERLVYLENQFLWSPELVAVLRDKLLSPPSDEFRLVVVLPADPNNGNEDTRGQLGRLIEADAGAGRFLACTLHQPGEKGRQVYVHAKIGIVDDRWLTVGSANLNEHSLFNDTELNVVTHDPALARATRLQLWSEHLLCDRAELENEAHELVDARWRPLAEEQLRLRRAGLPLTHTLVLLPHVSRRATQLLGPLNSLLVDG